MAPPSPSILSLHAPPYLVLQVFDRDQVAGVVVAHHRALREPIADLALQLVVLLLQRAHALKVGGQAVVEVLQRGLLVGAHVQVQAVGTRQAVGQVEAATTTATATGRAVEVAAGGGGDAGAATTGSPVHAEGPGAVGSGDEGHGWWFSGWVAGVLVLSEEVWMVCCLCRLEESQSGE